MNQIFCYLCKDLIKPDCNVANWAGHRAHQGCISKAVAAGLNENVKPGVSDCPEIPITPAVPRMWDQNPDKCGIVGKCMPDDPNPPRCCLLAGHGGVHMYSRNEEPKEITLTFNPSTNPKGTIFGDKGYLVTPVASELLTGCPDTSAIIDEVQQILILLLTKNRAYGSSFRSPLQVFSKLSPVEAINARMDDKLARIKTAKDFSEDTELDLVGYIILKRIAMKLEKPAASIIATWGDKVLENQKKVDFFSMDKPLPDTLFQPGGVTHVSEVPEKMAAYREMCAEVKGPQGVQGNIGCCGGDPGPRWDDPRPCPACMSGTMIVSTGPDKGPHWKCKQCGSEYHITSPASPATPAAVPAPPYHSAGSEGPAAGPPA